MKNQVKKLIQVSYNISERKTKKRELKALELASKALNCTDALLLSLYTDTTETTENNVKIQDVISWLVSPREIN